MKNDNNNGITTKKELSNQADSEKDKKALSEKTSKMDLPDPEEIPGQEKIHANTATTGDITAASADEEGDDVFEDDIDQEIEEQESDVSEIEQEILFKSANDMPGDDELLRKAELDNTDEDGEPLNEVSAELETAPDDLDVPGTSLDDMDEQIGEEDEENNEYSLGDNNDEGNEDELG